MRRTSGVWLAVAGHDTTGSACHASAGAGTSNSEEISMAVTVILELKFKPESVAAGRDVMGRALQDTRAFDGNLRTDVLVDEDDDAHWLIYEIWDTVEHDEAYRRFRAGDGRITDLPPLLAEPPVKKRYITSDI
jgi:quinol monooxygenase YgiN